jgi:hypothetical protein
LAVRPASSSLPSARCRSASSDALHSTLAKVAIKAFNSAGNVIAAVSMGLLGYFVSNRSIFFLVAVFAVPTIFVLLLIRPTDIDYEVTPWRN